MTSARRLADALRLPRAAALLAALAFVFAAGPAAAQFNADQRQVLANINAWFNAIRTMQGEFIQVGPNGEQSDGIFFISRPGRVFFQYRPPSRLKVIADGSSVSVEDSAAQTQDIYPLKRTPLRHLLADRIDLSSEAVVRDVQIQPDLISVVLNEESLGEGSLTLIFDSTSYELRQWVVTDAQGLNTSVAIFNVDFNKPADRSRFRIFIQNH